MASSYIIFTGGGKKLTCPEWHLLLVCLGLTMITFNSATITCLWNMRLLFIKPTQEISATIHTLAGTTLEDELFGLLRKRVSGMPDLFCAVVIGPLLGLVFSPSTL